ncbi:MAG TPA: hypothetical protein VEJ84_20200 [Acidimicrobiales bacterium]|nr:hypothetical protein [Acidimicrobiales bacterium]
MTTRVKRLEQDRDAGAVTSTGQAYLAGRALAKERLWAARPNTLSGHQRRKS